MPLPSDIAALKVVRRELNRRPIDISLLHVHVSHGVVYFQGQVRALRGHTMDIHDEMNIICRIIKQRGGIRDVVLDLKYKG